MTNQDDEPGPNRQRFYENDPYFMSHTDIDYAALGHVAEMAGTATAEALVSLADSTLQATQHVLEVGADVAKAVGNQVASGAVFIGTVGSDVGKAVGNRVASGAMAVRKTATLAWRNLRTSRINANESISLADLPQSSPNGPPFE